MSDSQIKERFPVRKNPRLKQFDYSSPNYYFVTICTRDKACIFGTPGSLNRRGRIAQKGLLEIEKHFPNVRLDKYVIMPNHIHAILVLQGTDVQLPVVVGQYKSFVTRQIRQTEQNFPVWQSSYHDRVIRNQKSYESIWLYIESNPLNWNKDCFFTE